jgi:hypothetical protein
MSGIRKIFVTACAIFLTALAASGQTPATVDIPQLLKEEGFEDIQSLVINDTVFVSIENRTYRGTFRGAATAIKKLAEQYPQVNNFEIVLKDYKMPQLIVHASKREGLWDVRVDREMKQALTQLKTEKPTAASTGKIDITFIPIISLVNNKLDHLFDYNVMIAPAIAATLWKGARLTLQPIFPIINNLEGNETERYIQVGNATLCQQILSTKHWHIAAAAGFFDPERLGAHARIAFHAFRGLDLYLDAGYTFEANYTPQNGFGVRGSSGQIDAMLKADYYERHSKLQIELQGGRFLYGDYGGRLDVTRHFSEYAIGVYGILTGGEYNAGFHFAIPVGGKRQLRKGFLRPRLPEYFNWEYSMQSYYKYWLEKMGRKYTMTPDQNRSAHYWEPDYIQEYISRILNGSFK